MALRRKTKELRFHCPDHQFSTQGRQHAREDPQGSKFHYQCPLKALPAAAERHALEEIEALCDELDRERREKEQLRIDKDRAERLANALLKLGTQKGAGHQAR